MADGIKISELGANGTLDQAADYLPVVQPAQSPKNRKILAQDLLAPARAYTDLETTARGLAVTAEATARADAVTAEATARADADTALGLRIDDIINSTPMYTRSTSNSSAIKLRDLDNTPVSYTASSSFVQCSASADRKEFHLTIIANFPAASAIPSGHHVNWELSPFGAIAELYLCLTNNTPYSVIAIPIPGIGASMDPNFTLTRKDGGLGPGDDYIAIDKVPGPPAAVTGDTNLNIHVTFHILFP